MMKQYKEVRLLGAEALRRLCIDNNWYTMGDNEEYAELLRMASSKNLTTDEIVEIVEDIIDHSDLTADDFTNVAYIVANAAHTHFEEVTNEVRIYNASGKCCIAKSFQTADEAYTFYKEKEEEYRISLPVGYAMTVCRYRDQKIMCQVTVEGTCECERSE